jgi:NADPH:quinone reductase-like Zn-dependent oxidoreductase
MSTTTVELRSLITLDGELRLTLEDVAVAAPGPDEVVVRVEAAPRSYEEQNITSPSRSIEVK